jgi:hypothetical protein
MLKICVSPKRECLNEISANWYEDILKMSGVQLLGMIPSHSSQRMQIKATAEAFSIIKSLYANFFNIEEEILF